MVLPRSCLLSRTFEGQKKTVSGRVVTNKLVGVVMLDVLLITLLIGVVVCGSNKPSAKLEGRRAPLALLKNLRLRCPA